jgi:hypothetical protein
MVSHRESEPIRTRVPVTPSEPNVKSAPSAASDNMTTFHIRVNDGPKQIITVQTSIYLIAVAAVPALFGLSLPVNIEIWVPGLMPDYGPHHYRIRQDEFVGLVIEHLEPR